MIITSSSNPEFKQLKKLTSSKERRKQGLAIAEGIHLAKSLIDSELVINKIFLAESALNNSEISELLQSQRLAIKQLLLADHLFESITSVHAAVGLSAVFTPPVRPDTITPLTTSALLLEDIQDPGNLGTILRTAAASDITTVQLSSGCASAWSPRALRAGMGAQFHLDIHENVNLAKSIQQAQAKTLVTTLSSDSHNLYETDLSQPTIWIFGNEGQGVSQQLIKLASQQVHIPQATAGIESLNVAVAASICLYEQYRQQNYLI